MHCKISNFKRFQCLAIAKTSNLKKVKVNDFKCIHVHTKQGIFRKKEITILSLYMNLNAILSTDIYVVLSISNLLARLSQGKV